LTFVLDTKHSRAQTQFGSEELLALDVQAKDPLFVDFNGDAFIDIIDYDDSGIKVQLNNGIGGFFESDLIYGVLEASTLAAEDLDQDGDPDILFVVKTVPFERKLGVLWNDGTGQITPESIDLEAGVVKSLLIDDLDNDGHTDLVALYDRDNDLWYDVIFYKQTAEAGFEDAVFLYEKYDDTSMRIHDTDDDGLEDFIFLWQNDTRIYTNKNLGGLVFDLFVPFLTFTRAITNFDLVDFDKDGDNDILLTTTAIEDSDVGSELIVVENKGDGVHIPISIFSYAVNEAFLKFDHTDIEGDGDTDIVFLNGLNQELWFIRNLGNFEFSQLGLGQRWRPRYSSLTKQQ